MARQIDVIIERSGIASVLSVASRTDAEQLRDYLKGQDCRVGEIFEAGEFAFFAYSQRQSIVETVKKHNQYRLTPRRSEVQ